jgi:glutamate/tyrosine decarboxylase-like PLP-dependent enzyme
VVTQLTSDQPNVNVDLNISNSELGPVDAYQDVLGEAAQRAQNYIRSIQQRHVQVSGEAIEKLPTLGGPLTNEGQDPSYVLQLLDEIGSPATMATMGRRFFGGVIGGAFPVAVAAHWLADAWDQNACLYDFSPVAAHLEDVVLDWLLRLFGLPLTSGGAFTTGTQVADMTALAAARYAVLNKAGWDIEEHGLFGAPAVTVIVGEEVHATMLKALRMLGFGNSQLRFVGTDSQGRMKASEIPFMSGPAIVCAQVGNVNTGACDPVGEISEVAHDMGAWVHVDGAFGLWVAASPARRHLVKDVAEADSWATDAHKWLNVPHDSGIVIVREPRTLQAAMAIAAAYYPEPTVKREPMQWGPESSRRARAVEIWATLRFLGRHGVRDLVERTCGHAARFAEGLRAAGYEVLNDVVLNQVLISFGQDFVTDSVIREVQEEGTCWCGGTVWKGRKAMRISVSSWATTESDVRRSLEAIIRSVKLNREAAAKSQKK